MDRITELEKEIEAIKLRNTKVEMSKNRETSWTRKVSIIVLTYLFVVLFSYSFGFDKPFISAIVPTMGFLLSTVSISIVKTFWIKYIFKSK